MVKEDLDLRTGKLVRFNDGQKGVYIVLETTKEHIILTPSGGIVAVTDNIEIHWSCTTALFDERFYTLQGLLERFENGELDVVMDKL